LTVRVHRDCYSLIVQVICKLLLYTRSIFSLNRNEICKRIAYKKSILLLRRILLDTSFLSNCRHARRRACNHAYMNASKIFDVVSREPRISYMRILWISCYRFDRIDPVNPMAWIKESWWAMPFLSVQSVWIRVLGKNLLSITFLFYSLNADIRKMRNVLEKITKYNEAWTLNR